MKSYRLEVSKAAEVISKWLDPQKSSVVLCQNVVDIMRLRIFFHETLFKSRKSFFNVHFITADQWIRKTFPLLENSQELSASRVTEKIFLYRHWNQYLENKNPASKGDSAKAASKKYLETLIKLPGFKGSLLWLWHLYTWNGILNRGKGPKKEDGLQKELSLLWDRVQKSIEEKSILLAPRVYSKTQEQKFALNPSVDQVLCVFPGSGNVIEKYKMDFLISLYPCLWRFVFYEDRQNELQRQPESLLSQFYFHLPENYEIMFLRPDSKEEPTLKTQDWFETNKLFFKTGFSGREVKVWMGAGIQDEYHLLCSALRTLYENGVSAHKLFILYTSKKDVFILEYVMRQYGFELNHPEKISAKTLPVISLFLDLVDLMNLKKDSTRFLQSRFLDFFQNPAFVLNQDGPEALKELFEYLKENISPFAPFNPEQLSKQIRSKSGQQSKETMLYWEKFATWLSSLVSEGNRLSTEQTFTQHAQNFYALLENHVNPEIFQQPFYEGQLNMIKKIKDGFSHAAKTFEETIAADFFYQMIYDELVSIRTGQAQNPGRKPGEKNNKFPVEIYARHISEGVHSPVDYLFICGLTSKGFPVLDQQPDFLGLPGYELSLSHDEQKKELRDSFSLVSKGVCLLFNPEKDPAPSDFIFDYLQEYAGLKLRKQDLMPQLPLYRREQWDQARSGENTETVIAGLNHYVQEGWQDSRWLKPHEMDSSFRAKFLKAKEAVRDFTGLAEPVSTEAVNSISLLDSLRLCPQLFWYYKIHNLEAVEDYHDTKYFDKMMFGVLFHQAADYFIDSLVKKYHGLVYGKILSSADESLLDRLMEEGFEQAKNKVFSRLESFGKIPFSYFREKFFQDGYYELRRFFNHFFHEAQKEDHPLNGFFPLFGETPFEKVSLGAFVFKGRMDRIDFSPKEKTVYLIDYKTGKNARNMVKGLSPENLAALEGFQLPLYTLSVMDILEEQKSYTNIEPKEILSIKTGYQIVGSKERYPSSIVPLVFGESEFSYHPDQLRENLEPRINESLHILREVLNKGYFFSFGHKMQKNLNPDAPWETPCSYCSYGQICDRSPFEAMLKRIGDDPLATEYQKNFMPM